MLEQLRQRAARAVEVARSAGAGDVFATAVRRRTVEFRQRDEILERVQESTSSRVSFRLWVDGRYSEHSTSDLASGRLEAFAREAVSIARALDVDRDRLITDPSLYQNRSTDDLDLVDPEVRALDTSARSDLCGAIVEAGRRHEQVISITASVSDTHGQSVTVSSNGFSGEHEWTSLRMSGHVTLRDTGDLRPDGYYGVSATHRTELPAATLVGAQALDRAVSRLGATQGPTRRTTMIVEPRNAGSLISRLLRPANAEAFSQERSYFRGRLGEVLFSNRLSVHDDPLVHRGLSSRHFDREGISARALPLVVSGRVDNIYTDTYYGRKVDMSPTTGSPSNFVVTPGERSLEQLIADAGEGVLITSWIGGNADPTTGEYSIGLRGRMIEGGQLGRPVSEMNVSGNIIELFDRRRLTAVGNDPWLYSSARVPTLVFEDVQFSGA